MFQLAPVSAPRFDPTHLRTRTRVPAARLAASQRNRLHRVVAAAVRLAEKGGFGAVRLRDVAEVSDVALGTLYKYFHSKEDILLFALAEEVEKLEAAMGEHAFKGATPLERVTEFFEQATRVLTRKPHFARAVLRSLASGDKEIAVKVAGFHSRVTRLIVAALRGEAHDSTDKTTSSDGGGRDAEIAFILQNVWFASLVGWAGGLHPARAVADQVRMAAALMRVPS